MSQPIVGVVLAGGRSSRMGERDKAFARVGDVTLLSNAVSRLSRQLATIAVNANTSPHAYEEFGLPVIEDTFAGRPGPLAGILAAMEWGCSQGADGVVTVAVDTPFFPRDLVTRLTADSNGTAPVLARSNGRVHPTFGLWPTGLHTKLELHLAQGGDRRVARWAEAQDSQYADFPNISAGGDDVDPFLNVNTPEDLSLAQALYDRYGR